MGLPAAVLGESHQQLHCQTAGGEHHQPGVRRLAVLIVCCLEDPQALSVCCMNLQNRPAEAAAAG